MSGICGLFNFDGIRVTPAELAGMTAMLAARGPDGNGVRLEGVAGLGHTLLTTTPEDTYERQPIRDHHSGCLISADVRLDNREELLDALGLRHRRDMVSDAGLLLSTYLAWGEDCLDRLLGDFAFAVFDTRESRLFCARDAFGLRPFYYHRNPARFFAFASSPQSILTLPQVPYEINEERIADFLVPQLEWIDYTSTFFEGVHRLPPGHKLSVTPERFELSEYRPSAPGPDPGPLTDEEYVEGFVDVFTKAVEDRLRVPTGAAGSMLSGGLDSGTTVAVARQLLRERGAAPLPTYSAVRMDATDCPESMHILSSTGMAFIDPTLVHAEAIGDATDEYLSGNEEPFDGEFSILQAVYRAAHHDGRTVILDGAAGDAVLSEGTYIARLIRAGRFGRAMREIVGERRFWGGPSVAFLCLGYARTALVPEVIKQGLRPSKHRRQARQWQRYSVISRDFADRIDLDARIRQLQHSGSGSWQRDYSVERAGAIRRSVTAGRERYARMAAACGIEARDPFLDRRVVDFCTRLPGQARLKDGWPKMLLREAMSGQLPDDVRWATGRYHLGWYFNAIIAEQVKNRTDLALERLQRDLEPYVDPFALAIAWNNRASAENLGTIHSAAVLASWLRESAHRPVVTAPPESRTGATSDVDERNSHDEQAIGRLALLGKSASA